jgi:DnaJ-class molecular chaperone
MLRALESGTPFVCFTLCVERRCEVSQPQVNHALETCAWCTGTGKWAVSMGYVVSCIVCGGKGKVMMAQPAGPCRQCKGSGRRSVVSPCLTCAGTGWERVFDSV